MRQMATGTSADGQDEYIQIGESTALQSLKTFCQDVVYLYKDEYLRKPTVEDTQRLLEEARGRGLPGMLGSLYCTHWEWKNCPTAWHGLYCGKEKVPTLVLEFVSSYDTWIWHTFLAFLELSTTSAYSTDPQSSVILWKEKLQRWNLLSTAMFTRRLTIWLMGFIPIGKL